jgi:DHA2 family multidrug resistance protein-like MFS transporter
VNESPDDGTVRRWLGFAVVSLGMMMTFLNITETVSTLAPIHRSLHASSAELVWVTSIYSMLVASLVLSAGTLGDIVGRRLVFGIGAAILGAGSLATFLANGTLGVIAGEAVMGIGGAMILPNSLAIVTHAFIDPHERTTAVSIWTAVSGLGLAIGPLVAGGLLQVFSWHSVFLVNAVLAAAVIALTPLFVADSRHPDRHLDPSGLLLTILAIASLSYAVIEGGQAGFGSTRIIAAFAVALTAATAFIVVEARSKAPMLHLRLFRISSFTTANLVGLVAQYAFVGIAIAEVLYFEQIRHYSILSTGLRLMPLMASYVVVSAVAAKIVRRAGFKRTIAAGLTLSAAGVLLIVTQQPGTAFASTAVVLALIGVGSGLILPPTTAAAVISVPHSEGGMASATVNMFRQVGNTLGSSITGTILTSGLVSRLPAELEHRGVTPGVAAHVARSVRDGSTASAAPSGLVHTIVASVGDAFVGALHLAVLIPGLAGLLAAAATVAFIRNQPAHA